MSNYLVVGPNVKVLPDQPINNLTGATSASLMGAGNEFLSFQIVIAAGANPLTGLDASVPGPIGSDGFQIPAADVRLYREDYYEVGTNKQSGPDGNPGRWPDPLIPITDPFYDEDRGAFPIDIPANENRVIWVDVFIAAGTPRGGYQGVVQVSTDAWTEQVRVDVTVVAFTLPPTSTLRSAFTMTPSATGTAFGLDCTGNNAPPSEACWALNELFVATALDHRITISGPAPDKLNSDTIPYFNKYVRPYLDGTGTSKTKLPKAQLTTIEYTHDLAAWQHAVGPLNTDAEPFVYFRGSDICDEIYINKLMTCAQWQSTCWPLIQTALNAWPHARILMTVDIQTSDACGIAAAINGANSGGDVILAPVIDHMDGNPPI